jgi:hypothetical protein
MYKFVKRICMHLITVSDLTDIVLFRPPLFLVLFAFEIPTLIYVISVYFFFTSLYIYYL